MLKKKRHVDRKTYKQIEEQTKTKQYAQITKSITNPYLPLLVLAGLKKRIQQ